jgi:hypothetical protein
MTRAAPAFSQLPARYGVTYLLRVCLAQRETQHYRAQERDTEQVDPNL